MVIQGRRADPPLVWPEWMWSLPVARGPKGLAMLALRAASVTHVARLGASGWSLLMSFLEVWGVCRRAHKIGN